MRERASHAFSLALGTILLTAGCGPQPAPVKPDDAQPASAKPVDPQPASVKPDDPEIIAAVKSALDRAIAAAMAADAEGALSITTKDDDFTFISGDTMLAGYDQSLEAFRQTYAMLRSQTNEVLQSRVRVLSPDVVLVAAVSEGTYTDKTGFTSAPVGLGSTIVFVRRKGEWRAIHYHQSVAK